MGSIFGNGCIAGAGGSLLQTFLYYSRHLSSESGGHLLRRRNTYSQRKGGLRAGSMLLPGLHHAATPGTDEATKDIQDTLRPDGCRPSRAGDYEKPLGPERRCPQ